MCAYVHKNIAIGDVISHVANVLAFHLVSHNIFILLVYRPPSNSLKDDEQICSFIADFCVGKEIIVLGDFNLPNLDWTSSNPSLLASPMERDFHSTFTSLGLHQWVLDPTFPRSGNILDLVLTSEPDRVGNLDVIPPLPGCDHSPTVFDYVFTDYQSYSAIVPKGNCGGPLRAWHKGHYELIRHCLRTIDWDCELALLDADKSFNYFLSIISDLIDEHVPDKPPASQKPPWPIRPPTSLINQRQKAWNHYKAVRGRLGRRSHEAFAAYAAFAVVNRQHRGFAVQSQISYEEKLMTESKENPKLLHAYIRHKKVGRPMVGPLKDGSGQLTDQPQLMTEIFATAFASVYTRNTPSNPHPHQLFDGSLHHIFISPMAVCKVLGQLDGNSAMGPDGIHPLLLKLCCNELAYPLCIIFNRSLQEGRVPSTWKSSSVIPIFKKGLRYNPLNYRPISLTSICCKAMERIVCSHLRYYLESNQLLSPHQYGFRTGRSTMDQLLLFYNTVSLNTDRGLVTDVILFDFSKAFDVVCHTLLLTKLSLIGINGCMLQWISSFLTDRTMRVCIKGSFSQPRQVLSGVPQDSVLGPLLFLIYINNVASQLHSTYAIFADDLKMLTCTNYDRLHHQHQSQVTRAAQRDINALYLTAASWGLHMNPTKCAVLRFTKRSADLADPKYFLNGLPIQSLTSHVDLGVTIDVDLKFHEHILSTVHKAGGLAHSLLKSTVCRSPTFMLFLLTTHIRPIIEYCSCVWSTGYIKDLQLLENVQRKWTKHISGLSNLSYGERLKTLDLYSIQGRLLRADLIQCWKVFHRQSCIAPNDLFDLSPQGRTRGHCFKIFMAHTRTDTRKRFFSVRCVPMWNSLPEEVVCSTNLKTFKQMLHSHLHDYLYAFN